MPDVVVIKHPQLHNTGNARGVPRQFIAAGTAEGNIKWVEGQVTKRGGGPTTAGELVCWVRRGRGVDRKYHWMILFTVDTPGPYDLKVTGYAANGGQLDIAIVEPFAVRAWPNFGRIDTDYPQNGQDITPEAQYFVAYGTMTHEAETAHMNTVGADFIHNDITIPIWAATFPPLAPDNYTLYVVDVQGHQAPNVNGLTVN